MGLWQSVEVVRMFVPARCLCQGCCCTRRARGTLQQLAMSIMRHGETKAVCCKTAAALDAEKESTGNAEDIVQATAAPGAYCAQQVMVRKRGTAESAPSCAGCVGSMVLSAGVGGSALRGGLATTATGARASVEARGARAACGLGAAAEGVRAACGTRASEGPCSRPWSGWLADSCRLLRLGRQCMSCLWAGRCS